MSDSIIQGEQLRGHLEGMILAILEAEPMHGFNIVKQLQERGEGSLNLREGTIYPVLYRMEGAGLIQARWDESQRDRLGPKRKVYSLKKKGHRQLAQARRQWQQFVQVVGNIIGAAT